jgi:hypothetical protein
MIVSERNFAQVGFVPQDLLRIFFFVEGHILADFFWSSKQYSAKMCSSMKPEISFFSSCRRFFVIGEAGFFCPKIYF